MLPVLLFASSFLSAQSTYIPYGANGSVFSPAITLGSDEIQNVSMSLGSSIGGFLDIGVLYEVFYPNGHTRTTRDERFAINFGTMIMKQGDLAPISVEINGMYGFSNTIKKSFEKNRLQKKGIGYSLHLGVLRDFILHPILTIHISAVASYSFMKHTTDLNYVPDPSADPDADPLEYPQIDQENLFLFGGGTALTLTVTEGFLISLGTEILLDTDWNVRLRPELSFVTFIP